MSNSTTYSILLIDYGVSYYYFYAHPVISFFAMIFSIICTVVLASKELRTSGAFFQYSLVNSFGTIIGSFILIFLFLTRCGGSPCSISTAYFPQAYTNYIISYAYVNIYLVSGLIQIAIGLQLYFTIKQKHKSFTGFSPYKMCFILLFIISILSSILIFINKIDTFTITSVDTNGHNVSQIYYYSHVQTDSPLLSLLVLIIVIISSYIFFFVLLGVNILNYRELRKLVENKKRMFGRASLRGSIRGSIRGSDGPTKVILVQPRSSSILSLNQPPRMQRSDSIKPIVHRSSIDSKDGEEKRMLRRSLIMTLWISSIFSLNRLIKLIYRTMVFVNQYSPYTYYLNAFSYLLDLIMYSSFFFVYMKTNKVFKKKFFKIVLRRRQVGI